MFFSTFPDGYPGLGLLLLRGAVGLSTVVQGGIYLIDGNSTTHGISVVGLLGIIMGASLLIGFLTPVISFLTGLSVISIALWWLPMSAQNLFDTALSIFFVVVMSTAIFLLGPGAFSIDARLFGRREIIIPPKRKDARL